jgi:parvulin-like peptidyl-prolyl isomerase
LLLSPTFAALSSAQNSDPVGDTVSATVDGEPIYRREVDRALGLAVAERSVQTATSDELRREALRQLINRRLVLAYLEQNGMGASRQEIDREVRRAATALKAQDLELDDHLAKTGLTRSEFQRRLAWDIGWRRFLEKHLTDANLARYFQQHRRDFDGTKVLAAHILFRVETPADQQALDRTLAQAADVRRRIRDGELTFADAARRYSTSPSAEDGGRIGPIGRHEPMPEAFSRAAFALDEGAISDPVVSPHGVHLIQCQGIEAGPLQWQEVRNALEKAVIRHLFRWAADQQRPHAVVEIMEGR